MKIYLSLITAAALALTACSQEAPKPATPATPAAPASEAVAPVAEQPASEVAVSAASAEASAPATTEPVAAAGECAIEIISDDAMKFDPKEINVKSSCKDFTITLKHVGKMPKAAMGHNVVVTKAADKDGVLADGAQAGVDKDYLKEGDARVVATTKLIGGGEQDAVTFPVSKLAKGEAYEFFCSFPGHSAMMSGKLNLVD